MHENVQKSMKINTCLHSCERRICWEKSRKGQEVGKNVEKHTRKHKVSGNLAWALSGPNLAWIIFCILTDRLLRAQEGPAKIIKNNIKQMVFDRFLSKVHTAGMPNAEPQGSRSRQKCLKT